MADQLTDFLRTKKQQSTMPDVDWESKKDEWLRAIDLLYDTIRRLLEQPLHDGLVELVEVPIQVTEDSVGTYEIPELQLRVGRERVAFTPKGVNVVGASGRVDLRGDRGTVTLVRGTNGNEQWRLVLQRIPRLVLVPLDKASLRTALERVMLP